MDYNEQAGKNFAWLSIAQFASRLMGAAFYFFLSFKLLAAGLGEYSFVSSFVPLWLIFSDLGVSGYLYREWAKGQTDKQKANQDFGVIFAFTTVLTFVIFTVFLAANFYMNREIMASLALFFLAMYLAYFVHVNDLYLQSINVFRQPALRQVVEKLAVVIVGGALLLWQAKVTWVFVAILLSQVISYLYYRLSGFSFKVRFIWNFPRIWQLIKKGLPFMLLGLGASIYGKIDIVMLRYLKNFDAVGLYGAAYKFMDIAVLFAGLFLAAIFPVLSVLYNDKAKKQAFLDFFNSCLRISFSSALLIALFFIFAAPELFKFFFPGSFDPSILALRILIIAQALTFLSMLFNSLIIIQNRERMALYIVMVSAAANIGLNFFLIPKFSFYGAAWATVVAEIVNLYLLQHFSEWQMRAKTAMKMLAFLLCNALLLLLARERGYLNIWWLGAIIFILNAALLFWSDLLRREDVGVFLKPFKSKILSLWPTADIIDEPVRTSHN